ncbi:hypothetical protein KDN32_19060 [Nocardioides sp. J2M5]|uniref:hypothetical protein n=1 Tax=Nocardioides palaemonis TaxID=2829810 RepID=UPI001BA64847|nr:hypothetical protein [Nocardioides palaemonis]MBS2939845.1 hypothetical protein [Nocardioides palaemonis]
MRRTTTIIATGLLGAVLLVPATGSTAAAVPTCQGEAATLVGTKETLVGTKGRDVIVTGKAFQVKARGGDDLICVVPRRTGINVLYIEAGSGDDVVDTTSATLNGYYVDTHLGGGSDTLEGGRGGDWVETGDATGDTSEVDVVRTGAGDDRVTTSGGADVVDLGPGNDDLTLDGPGTSAGGTLEGGDGYDTFTKPVGASGEHAFDLAAGTFRSPTGAADFPSFESLTVEAGGAAVAITGTEGDDYVTVTSDGTEPSTVVADLGDGDDDLLLDGSRLGAASRIDLGSGADRLVAARRSGHLALDLTSGTLEIGRTTFSAGGVEDAFAMARRVEITGDAQDNSLSAFACRAAIVGRGGDDELIWQGDYIFESYSFGCRPSAVLRGGAGDDSFYGSRGDDRILGGAGDDLARGGAGRDRCVAERKQACER